MANQKITELDAVETLVDSDLMEAVQDVATTPVNKKATFAQIKAFILAGASSNFQSHKFTTQETWTALSELDSETLVQILINATALTKGFVQIFQDDDVVDTVLAGQKISTIHNPSSSLVVTTFGIGYDISTGTFTQIALSVSAQESSPTAMLYNNDGTKLYVLGRAGDDINEYALSTAYDISTATYTQIALSVSAQETSPISMMFNNDGTKLYVLGDSGADINEYALSTAYDISTGTFTQIALSVSAQESSPYAMLYNNDGTKLYVMGASGDDINEYALSTAYDISTGTYTQIALSVSAQESSPFAMMFNNDGTTLYVLGLSGDNIHEYALSTAYDISTATYTQIALSVSAQESSPTAMMYNNDGTKLYVLGRAGDDINEYDLAGGFTGEVFATTNNA